MIAPQNIKSNFRRLSFEQIGGDDFHRAARIQKGIMRELLTPTLSVPYSAEGTSIFEQIDRNDVLAAIRIRGEITSLIVNKYPVAKLQKVRLSYLENYSLIKEQVTMRVLVNAPPMSAEVFDA